MTPPSSTAVRRTAGNAAALVAAYVVGRGLAFVAVVVAARIVGTEAFGTYGAAAALAVMASLVSTLGMTPLLVREMARDADESAGWLAAADRVKHGSNVLMLGVLWWVAGPLLDLGSTAVAASLLLGAGYALGSYAENRLAWTRAVERMSLVTRATAVYGVVAGLAGVIAIAVTGSVVVFCGAPVLGQAAVLVFLRARLPSPLLEGRPRPGQVAELVRSVVPFAAGFVALTLFYKVDVLLLERWRSREEVGLYVAAYRFVDLAHALALAGVGAVYPSLARRAGRAGRDGTGGRVGELVILAWAPFAAVLFLGREAATVGMFGGEYAEAVPVLALLTPAIPALAFDLYAAYLLGAADRMRWMAGTFAVGLALKVGLDAWLIPSLGARGAALATLVAEVVLAALFAAVLARVLDAVPRPRVVATVAGVLALAAACAILPAPAGGIVRGAVFLVATAALYRAVGVITPGEWSAVKGALTWGVAPGRPEAERAR
ncbi:MAG TPA: oligosaccharide flippase family protein [Longimicrobiales bacterium]|nr:oligosaccharide flippase family protein [Longimicrobiales bacterium]